MTSGVVVDRRAFIASTAILGIGVAGLGAVWVLVDPSEAAAATEAETFQAISELVTRVQDLDPRLAERAYPQLTELDATFPRRVAALVEMVGASGAKDVDAWLASPKASDEEARATAVTIVSAWYLGYTGTPIALRAEDDTGFVTFTKALMYEPTIDATVRPSYARAGTDYWIDPPPFVTPPPAPPGIRSWGRDSPQGIGAIPGVGSLAPPSAPSTREPVKSEP